MTQRLVTRTEFRGRVPFRLGPAPVHDRFRQFAARIAGLAGAEAAAFLAAPTITLGNGSADGSVAWETELPGDIRPFSHLHGAERDAIMARAQLMLSRLVPLLEDPDVGAWLRRALIVPGEQALFAVGNAPVLVDWGFQDPALADDTAALDEAMRRGLGPLLPSITPVAPAAQVPRAAAPAAAAAAAPAVAAAAPVVAARGGTGWLLPAAIMVAAIFLVLGIWIGTRMVMEQIAARPIVAPLAIDTAQIERAMQVQREQNAALEQRIAEVRGRLQQDACLAPPGGLIPAGPDRTAPVRPTELAPPAPGQPRFEGRLAELLDQAVVLVVVRNDAGVATGSGFFVTPEVIVTNLHVVEAGGTVAVANRALGVVQAQVIAKTPNSNVGEPDFALLRVPPQRVQPLALTTQVARLTEVIAAGFPSLISGLEASYAELLRGNAAAAANLQPVFTDGRIQAIQPFPSGLQGMPHSAQISPGSSGGPLVDGCGRVVGVNTFGRSSREMPISVSYAQKTEALVAFLRANSVEVTVLTEACTPPAPTPAALPATPAAPGAPAAPAAPAPAPAGRPAAPASAPTPAAPAAPAPAAPAAPAPAAAPR